MKSYLLFLFTVLINPCFSQNYLTYYQQCNEGDKQAYLKNYDAALKHYEAAFATVNYVHAYQLEQAAVVSTQVKNFNKTTEFTKKALQNGLPERFLQRNVFKKFRKTDQYALLKDSVAIFKKQHLASINLVYKAAIDSLHFIDQRIIRNNLNVRGNYQIDKTILPANKYDLDDDIFKYILELIEEFGFPSEKNIGFAGYQKSWVLLHHNGRLAKNAASMPMLKAAVLTGDYLPNDYAEMYRQSLEEKGETPIFLPSKTDLTQKEINDFNKIRANYGLKPLDSMQIKFVNNAIRIKRIW